MKKMTPTTIIKDPNTIKPALFVLIKFKYFTLIAFKDVFRGPWLLTCANSNAPIAIRVTISDKKINQVNKPTQEQSNIRNTNPSTKLIKVQTTYSHQAYIRSPNIPWLNLTDILLNLRAAFGETGTQAAFKIS